MYRLRSNGSWSLFDPYDVPELHGVFGSAFTNTYEHYERTVTPVAIINCQELWTTIAEAQAETGTPFIAYSDSING